MSTVNRNFNNYGTKGLKNPCYQCSDRKVGCHSKCEKYKKFYEENEAKKEEAQKEKQLKALLNGYNPAKKNLSQGKMRKTYREEHK